MDGGQFTDGDDPGLQEREADPDRGELRPCSEEPQACLLRISVPQLSAKLEQGIELLLVVQHEVVVTLNRGGWPAEQVFKERLAARQSS